MDIVDWLNMVALFLNISAVLFLLMSGGFWQKSLIWPRWSRGIGALVFERLTSVITIPSLWGVLCILVAFILQLAAILYSIAADPA
jgi:hypothetical protein